MVQYRCFPPNAAFLMPPMASYTPLFLSVIILGWQLAMYVSVKADQDTFSPIIGING